MRVRSDSSEGRTSLENEIRIGDQSIAYLTAGLLTLLAAVYILAPAPVDVLQSGADPVWPAISALAILTLVKFFMSRKRPLPGWISYSTMACEFVILFVLVVCLQVKYGQPAAFVLKTPTVIWVFVLIGIRALRFDPLEVIAAGAMAASGWITVTVWAIKQSPQGAITHDFVDYLSGPSILIGAEVEKVLAIILFSLGLAIAMHRGQRFMQRVIAFAQELAARLRTERRLLSRLKQEVEERRLAASRLRDALYTDALTGIPSRAALNEELDRRAALVPFCPFHLIVLDLCSFRRFNDTMGRVAGDTLLHVTARELQQLFGTSGFVARIAADEFAVLLPPGAGLQNGGDIAGPILGRFGKPVLAGICTFSGGANVGAALAATRGDVELIMHNAGLALNEAKRLGRQRSANYDQGQRERAERLSLLESELRKSIRSGQIWIAYQPIVCLQTDRIAGWEALLRWNHPVLGAVPPSDFIPLLEESGLINRVGRRILLAAAKDARTMSRSLGRTDLFMSVNISPFQLNDPRKLVGAVRRARSWFPGLKLELTESGVAEDPVRARAILTQLRDEGVQLSLDDFGTGMSSLAHLQQFQFDYLKIDKAFIRNEQDAFVKGILRLAESLQLITIAEGIETEADRDRLLKLGARYGQGFYWSTAQSVDFWSRLDGGHRFGPSYAETRSPPIPPS